MWSHAKNHIWYYLDPDDMQEWQLACLAEAIDLINKIFEIPPGPWKPPCEE